MCIFRSLIFTFPYHFHYSSMFFIVEPQFFFNEFGYKSLAKGHEYVMLVYYTPSNNSVKEETNDMA